MKRQRMNFVEYKYSRTTQYISCNVAFILGLITIAYIIMTMHVFSMNMAGGDNRGVLYVASFTCPPVPLTSGHLSFMYGHFCLVPRVSVHGRYYCREFMQLNIYFLNKSLKHVCE